MYDWKQKNYESNLVVKVMAEELISRQRKMNKLEKARIIWTSFLLGCLLIFVFFGYKIYNWKGLAFSGEYLSAFTSYPLFILLILVLVIAFIQLNIFEKKGKKAEKEFEELRAEFIDRNAELWEKDRDWKNREEVYSYMKKEYDINLYHK